MISYLLCNTQIGRHIGPISVLSEGVGVGRFEYQVRKCRVCRLGICERVHISVQIHI